jgi:hypothetical protein
MPLIHRISAASNGLLNRRADYIWSQKFSFLTPRLSGCRPPVPADMIGKGLDQLELLLSTTFPYMESQEHVSGYLTSSDALGDPGRYPNCKVI